MPSAFLCFQLVLQFAPSTVFVQHADSAVAADPVAETVATSPDPQTTPPADQSASAHRIFRALCLKCHDTDGTGEIVRDTMPKVPDFTDAAWHATRSDADLSHSILEGKGKSMPPGRGKLSEEQARGLVDYVRAFAPTAGMSGDAEREGPALYQPEPAVQSGRFFEKLIPWLGRFHPASVHFPIALLMAAAAAEFLRLATGKPAFDAISRFCIWFGTLTAVAAGVLGWFLARFRLTDESSVMMTHRWLGTATVVCACLVLVLSELGRRPDRRRTRICLRVALLGVAVLVSVTGFLGGAVVFGLDHYNWPR
jgi:uncharacterized membrane protein/cytochrome c5